MSRDKWTVPLTYSTESGERHRIDVPRVANPSLGGVDRARRLAEVVCPQGHLIAIAVRNGGFPPVILTSGAHGPAPMLVLEDGGLTGAMTYSEDGVQLVRAIGTPRESFPIDCGECVQEFRLSALTLRQTIGRRGRRVPRLAVSE